MTDLEVMFQLAVMYGGPVLLGWLVWKWWNTATVPSVPAWRKEADRQWWEEERSVPRVAPISKREEASKRREDYQEKLRIIAESGMDEDTKEAAQELALQWYRERLKELIQ